MAKNHEVNDTERTATIGLFGPQKSGDGAIHADLDVSYARLTSHERLSWPKLFEGYNSLRAITYSSSASLIWELFGKLREIEIIFGSDVSLKGDTARLFAASKRGGNP